MQMEYQKAKGARRAARRDWRLLSRRIYPHFRLSWQRLSGLDPNFERALHGTILVGRDLVYNAFCEVFDRA
jgi:hypothetical protein